MKKIKKSFIKKAVIMPVSIAVMVAAVFFAVGSSFQQEFNSRETVIAGFNAEKPMGEYNESDKSEAEEFYEKNCVAGALTFKNSKLTLIYDADASLLGAENTASVLNNGRRIGEVGCTYVYGYKSQLKELSMLQSGDEITVESVYGDYKFSVISVETVIGENSVLVKNPDASRSLVIYTDRDNGAGISKEYVVVIAEMLGGAASEGQVQG